jgi:hypothetical protein
MTHETVQTAFYALSTLTTLVSTIASITAARHSWHNRQEIQTIKIELNHRLTQLLETTGAEQRAIGKAEGAAERGVTRA